MSDYAYINARIRVMRSDLLKSGTLEEAVNATSYADFLAQLAESGFREDLGDATAQNASLGQLDAALSRNFQRTVNKIQSLAKSGQAASEINALVQKWDLQNIKTLVRGVLSGRQSQDILNGLIPAGAIKWAVLQSAASSSDVGQLAQTLAVGGGVLGRALRDAVQAGANSLLDIEIALDQAYYRSAVSASRGSSFRRYLARDIDIRNLMTALQLRGKNLNTKYFVQGGRDVSEADFARIAGGDNSIGSNKLQPLLETGNLSSLETASRKLLDSEAANMATSDALGVGIPLDYLRRKEMDIARLRLVGRAKLYGIPSEKLRQELGYV